MKRLSQFLAVALPAGLLAANNPQGDESCCEETHDITEKGVE